jgi:hypothetical protein
MLGAIRPLPQYVFMSWCLVKHRDNFAFSVTNRTAVRKSEMGGILVPLVWDTDIVWLLVFENCAAFVDILLVCVWNVKL